MIKRAISVLQISRRMSSFKFSDYDVISFDLDNTLLEYNLTNLFKLQYEFLSNFLTEKKGYNKTIFSKDMTEDDADFIQRSLFLDCYRGNVLYLRYDGYIIKASHGTKLMNDYAIEKDYGKNRKCLEVIKNLNNKLALQNCDEMKTFLDFTDCIGTLAFAKAVDSVDLVKNMRHDRYNVWPDILDGIIEMYKIDSSFSQSLLTDPYKYMYICSDSVLSWLLALKNRSKLILITGAEYEVARITLPFCLGDNFRDLFDLIIYDAQKPDFFTLKKTFTDLKGNNTNLKLGQEYRYGNWEHIYKTMSSELNKEIKCLYIGDNPLQDIYAPSTIQLKIDTVAIVEEVASEGLYPDIQEYPHRKYVSSKFWGPYLDEGLTLTGDILKTCSKLVVPSIKVVANKSYHYEHKSVLKHC